MVRMAVMETDMTGGEDSLDQAKMGAGTHVKREVRKIHLGQNADQSKQAKIGRFRRHPSFAIYGGRIIDSALGGAARCL
jgi:hypothetical protein